MLALCPTISGVVPLITTSQVNKSMRFYYKLCSYWLVVKIKYRKSKHMLEVHFCGEAHAHVRINKAKEQYYFKYLLFNLYPISQSQFSQYLLVGKVQYSTKCSNKRPSFSSSLISLCKVVLLINMVLSHWFRILEAPPHVYIECLA